MSLNQLILIVTSVFVWVSPAATSSDDVLDRQILFKNFQVFDGLNDQLQNTDVLISGNLISAVGDNLPVSEGTLVIEGDGETLMPGLIEMLTHLMFRYGVAVMRTDFDAQAAGAAAKESMDVYLQMGYTTLRDVGGNSLRIAKALKDGRISGPRIYSSGGAISPISGHNDLALFSEEPGEDVFSKRGDTNIISGPVEAREATRRLPRGGASQIKIMVGGGVASDFDPLYATTMTEDEIKAIIEAAADFGTYACAQAYTDESVNCVLDAGGRCIEHGFLVSEETIRRMKDLGAVMSLQPHAAVEVFRQPEKLAGFSAENARKGLLVRDGADQMRWVAEYELETFAGADLWQDQLITKTPGDMVLRARWFSNAEVLRQNTSSAGRWLGRTGTKNPYPEGPLGFIKEGAYADLLVVDGNPLQDLSVMLDYRHNLRVIMKDGEIYKNTL